MYRKSHRKDQFDLRLKIWLYNYKVSIYKIHWKIKKIRKKHLQEVNLKNTLHPQNENYKEQANLQNKCQ